MRAWVGVRRLVRRVPLLAFWWHLVDRVIWAWWVYGGRYEGVSRFRLYQRVERRWGLAYGAVYGYLWDIIYRNVGE